MWKIIIIFSLLYVFVGISWSQSDEEKIQERLEKSKEYINKGEYELARTSLESLVKDSNQKAGVEELIELYRMTGLYQKALELAQAIGKDSGKAFTGLLLSGEIFMYLGRYNEAKDAFLEAYSKKPENLRARANLGMYYFTFGQRQKYIEYFDKIMDEYRNSPPERDFTPEELTFISKACHIYAMKSDDVDRSETLKTIVHELLPEAIKKNPYYFAAYQEMTSIFLEAFNNVDAKQTIEDALKLNPHNPEMLYYKALYQSQDYGLRPQATSTLEFVFQEKGNPNLVEALELAASICLSDEEYEKADGYIQKALAINPNSLSVLSLRAAMYCMQARKSAFEQECQKILAINPCCGDLYHTVAMMLINKRQFVESVKYERKAIELDPYLWHAYIELGMNLMRIGEIEEAEKYFLKAEAEYNFHTQTHNMLILLKKYKEYKVINTEHFKIRLHVSEAETMSNMVKEALESAFETMSQKYKFKPPTPVLFELFPNHDDFSVRTIGLESLGASGACFGNVVVEVSPKSKKLGDFNWVSVAWHEFTHVITLQMTNFQVPRWFTEGLSELSEKQRITSTQRRLEIPLYSAYSSGQMRSIAELNSGFTRPRYPMEIVVCYYQAGLICDYLNEKYGFDKIIQMLLLYGQEKKDQEVFQIALGISLEEFDKQFKQWLEEKIFSKINVFPSVNPKQMDDMMDNVIEVEKALSRGKDKKKNTETLIALSTKLALGFVQHRQFTDASIYGDKILKLSPESAVAYDILGQSAFQKREYQKARPLLEKAVNLGSKNFETNLMLGLLYWQHLKNPMVAIQYLKKAKESYPMYVEGNNPYQKLAEIYSSMGKKEEALAELEQYLRIHNTDFKTRIEVAKHYFEAKQYEKAIPLLSEAQEIFPVSVDLQTMLSKSFKETGKPDMALKSYEVLVGMDMKEGKHRVYADMAEIYLEQKKLEKAKFCAQEALRLKPGFKPAEDVLEKIK